MISGASHLPEAHLASYSERLGQHSQALSCITTQALPIKLLQFPNETENKTAQRERLAHVKFIQVPFWRVGRTFVCTHTSHTLATTWVYHQTEFIYHSGTYSFIPSKSSSCP